MAYHTQVRTAANEHKVQYHSRDIEACIRSCWECRHECQTTFYNHCLEEGGEHLDTSHVKLMADCIQICQLTADFMTRNSDNHDTVCRACSEICEACGNSCEAIDDMSSCAQACYKCAKLCRDMVMKAGYRGINA